MTLDEMIKQIADSEHAPPYCSPPWGRSGAREFVRMFGGDSSLAPLEFWSKVDDSSWPRPRRMLCEIVDHFKPLTVNQ